MTPSTSTARPSTHSTQPGATPAAAKPASMTNAQLTALERQYSAPNYEPLHAVIATGSGVWLHDADGRKYLDMLAGYSALNFGHQHPRIMEAFFKQARRVTVVSRAFENDQFGPFAREICEFTGYEQVLPMNTGAEAVETAIKTARKWAYLKKNVPVDRAEIIVCEKNFHGRTTTIISFSATPQYRDFFGPHTPGFKIIPFGDVAALRKAITSNTAAFLVEPVQGEGGVNVPPPGYLKECLAICRENNVLMIADEVQTGFGRTGRNFACDHDGIKPDMLLLGKALGGGVYPISAALSSREIFSVFRAGDHGSTFGGNPLGSAVTREVIKVMKDERISERSSEMGEWLRGRLRSIKSAKIKEVRGQGMLNGIELHKGTMTAHDAVEALLHEGVLCKDTAGQVVRITPPITITKDEAEWGIERIAKVLA